MFKQRDVLRKDEMKMINIVILFLFLNDDEQGQNFKYPIVSLSDLI